MLNLLFKIAIAPHTWRRSRLLWPYSDELFGNCWVGKTVSFDCSGAGDCVCAPVQKDRSFYADWLATLSFLAAMVFYHWLGHGA